MFCQNPPVTDTHTEHDQGTSCLVSFQLLWGGKQVTSAIAYEKVSSIFLKWVSEYSIYNTEDSTYDTFLSISVVLNNVN